MYSKIALRVQKKKKYYYIKKKLMIFLGTYLFAQSYKYKNKNFEHGQETYTRFASFIF